MHAVHPHLLAEEPSEVAPHRTTARAHTARAHDVGLAEDLCFLAAWERGLVPWPGAFLRARQIYRAYPALAAALRAEPARCPTAGEGTVPRSSARGGAAAAGRTAHGH